MRGHFDNHLNLRQLILTRYPKLIVECGAGNGDCTRMLAYLKLMYDFELHSISDKELDIPEVEWHTGLSYKELPKFENDSIELLIIDTDHNYWTLEKELAAAEPKMKEGGWIVMHDVEEFYHDTGMAMSYWTGDPYPAEEIKKTGLEKGGLGDAVIDFLSARRGKFKLVRFMPEHFGIAVIEKKTVSQVRLITPGPEPVFAQAPLCPPSA